MPDPDRGHGRPDGVEEAVRAVLSSMTGDVTATEVALLAELEGLGRTVARAKAEIAALGVDDINGSHIPAATDELDAVIEHTAGATNTILDACEGLEGLAPSLEAGPRAAVEAQVTRIYEACSFQDITGQRIAKVVAALKAIESRINHVTAVFGGAINQKSPQPPGAAEPDRRTEGERLANGPQLPGGGTSQAEIDALLASFD